MDPKFISKLCSLLSKYNNIQSIQVGDIVVSQFGAEGKPRIVSNVPTVVPQKEEKVLKAVEELSPLEQFEVIKGRFLKGNSL